MNAGKLAPALETMLRAYAYGRPKDQIEITETEGAPLKAFNIIMSPLDEAGHAEW